MKTIYDRKGASTHYFSDLQSFLDEVSPAAMLKVYPDGSPAMHQPNTAWLGNINYPKAWEQCRTGITVPQASFDIRDALVKRVRVAADESPHWDVSGSSVDVGAFNTGVPECMLDFVTAETRSHKTVSLLCEFGNNSSTRAEQMQYRGAAFMGLIDALEASRQYRTQIYAVHGCQANNRMEIVIGLKTAGHMYDPHAMGFVLSSPAMLRRLVFAYYDLVNKRDPRFRDLTLTNGYGSSSPLHTIPEAIDTNCVDLTKDLGPYGIYSMPSAVKFVSDQLEAFNVLDKEGIA